MTREKALKQLEELKKLGGTMRLAAEGWREKWQILIAILMSARTRDEVTIVVGEALFQKYGTVDKLGNARRADVLRIVRPINFYHNKAKNVIGCARMLAGRYRGVPPETLEELVELPGVGRKTANVYLSEIGKDGLGVDTHVAYISWKLGWTTHANPHRIEADLKKLFPKKRWNEINPALVRFGKKHLSRRKKDMLLAEIRIIHES